MKKRVRERRERRRRVDMDNDRREKWDLKGGLLEGFLWDWDKEGGEDVGMVLGGIYNLK